MGLTQKVQSFKVFANEYWNYKKNNPTFKSATINITGKCNLDCLFCECQELNGKADLTLDEIKNLFTKLKDLGIESVFLGGGEPFIRRDIWEILLFLKNKGFQISSVSNGLPLAELSDEKMDVINQTVIAILISLDSPKPHLHNYYRNNKLAHAKVMKVISRLSRLSQTKLLLTMVVTNDNFEEIPEMIEFAREQGIKSLSFQPVSESTNFPDVPPKAKGHFLIPPERVDELRKIYTEAIQRADQLGIETNLRFSKNWIFNYFLNKKQNTPIFQNMVNKFECVLPFDEIYIRHNGDVQLCALLPRISSIRERNIKDVIFDIQKERESLLKGNFPPECKRCFCGLNRNIRFSIMSNPIKNFSYLKHIFS